jgi:hypothetical protein
MVFEVQKSKEEIVGLALQSVMEELTDEDTKLQIVAITQESQRNNAIEYLAANRIKVIAEVVPVFILEATKEDISFLSKESFVKKLDMPSTYKFLKGIK